ncbi:MAG: hypothetical protein AB8B55_14190 [Mariniblastus sp.]
MRRIMLARFFDNLPNSDNLLVAADSLEETGSGEIAEFLRIAARIQEHNVILRDVQLAELTDGEVQIDMRFTCNRTDVAQDIS